MAELETWLRQKLKQNGDVYTSKYGYFDVIRFLLPGLSARSYMDRVEKHIDTAIRLSPSSRLVIIAHSFGTYLVTKILEKRKTLNVDLLILCGSVVPDTYPWEDLGDRVGRVVNECGARDIWPVMAKSTTWGYSATGVFGCGNPVVQDRFHYMPHSGYLNTDFLDRFWWPLIAEGELAPSDWIPSKRPAPWWMRMADKVPVKWAYAPAIAAMLWFGTAAIWPRYSSCNGDIVTLHGKVVDIGGHPVPGVSVYVPPLTETAVTDDDGNYVIEVPNAKPMESLQLNATKAGYRSASLYVPRPTSCRVHVQTVQVRRS